MRLEREVGPELVAIADRIDRSTRPAPPVMARGSSDRDGGEHCPAIVDAVLQDHARHG